MITVGRKGSEIVIRNLANDTAIRLDRDDIEGFEMFVEMLVDELNDIAAQHLSYILESFDAGSGQ